MSEIIFISGIDTDAGKSFATGFLARQYAQEGRSVVTQKFIQTGCPEYSEDIDLHRRIQGIEALTEDLDHTTAPIVLSYPASAQLAAAIDNRRIDLELIDHSTEALSRKFDVILIEGAGGLMVPITDDFFAIDYAATRHLPIALVTNSKLGSINHTVLSLEAIQRRGIRLHSLIYNSHFDSADAIIAADTRAFIQRYIERHFAGTPIIDVPTITL